MPVTQDQYFFGNSLVNYAEGGPLTNIPVWMDLFADTAGNDFAASGAYGFLRDFADRPEPLSQWGFDGVDAAWDGGDFANGDLTSVIITPANFLQDTSPDTVYPGDSRAPLDAVLDIVGDVVADQPDAQIFIYEGWADMAPFSETIPPSAAALADYHDYNTGAYHEWYTDLVDAVNAAAPEADVTLIPVASVLSELYTGVLSDIPAEDLYVDSAPHGTETTYFLAGMVTYQATFGEAPPPLDAFPPEIDPAVAERYDEIIAVITAELDAAGLPSEPAPDPVDPVEPADPADPVEPVTPVEPEPEPEEPDTGGASSGGATFVYVDSSDPVPPEDPAPVEPSPVDPAPVEPVDPAPADPAPVDPAPVEPAPVDPAPVDPTPADPAPAEPAPVDPAPEDPAPADPAPAEPAPSPGGATFTYIDASATDDSDDAPTDPVAPNPTPVDPAPVDPTPTDPAPTDPAPAEPAPAEPAPADPEPTDPAPTEPAAAAYTAKFFDISPDLTDLRDVDFSGPADAEAGFETLNFLATTDPFAEGAAADNVATQFLQQVDSPEGGSFRIELLAEDQALVYVNGVLVLDSDDAPPESLMTAEIDLAPGTHEVEIQHLERGGEASLRFDMTRTGDLEDDPALLIPLLGDGTSIEERMLEEADTEAESDKTLPDMA